MPASVLRTSRRTVWCSHPPARLMPHALAGMVWLAAEAWKKDASTAAKPASGTSLMVRSAMVLFLLDPALLSEHVAESSMRRVGLSTHDSSGERARRVAGRSRDGGGLRPAVSADLSERIRSLDRSAARAHVVAPRITMSYSTETPAPFTMSM